MKRALLFILLLLLIFLGVEGWRFFGPLPAGEAADCNRIAERKVRLWKILRWDKKKINKAYQEALAACQGKSAKDDFMAAANFDYMRLGRQFLSGSVAPDDYLARVRDRSRKLRLARTVPGWADALSKGDDDGDFVPNDRDTCPNSPDLSLTDDHGCPQQGPLPKAPSREEIEKAKEAMHVAISPPCRDAPPPSFATPLQIGRDQNDPDSFYIAVSKSSDQPPACPVFYDIRIRSERSSFFAQTSGAAHFYFVFRSSDNVDHSPAVQFRNVFRVRKQNVPRWNDLVASAIEPSDREDRIAQVRMVNGNGLSRGWSAPRTFSLNALTQFFPAF